MNDDAKHNATDCREPARITQTVFGRYGNCQSVCLAMMLGIDLCDVPNFAQLAQEIGNNEAYAERGRWLRERGWGILTVVKWQSLPWPPSRGYFIAGGPSPRGHRHAVIYKDGELWHDPHPEGGGISEVEDIDFLYPLNPFSARSESGTPDPNAAGQTRESIIEECAKVVDDKFRELSKRSYPPPTLLVELTAMIRALKNAAPQAGGNRTNAGVAALSAHEHRDADPVTEVQSPAKTDSGEPAAPASAVTESGSSKP